MENKKKDIVLASTDFHDVADYAIEHAVGMAKAFGYKVVILHVIKRKKSKFTDEQIAQKLQGMVEKIKKDSPEVSVEYMTREGDPLYKIGAVGEEIGANFLTMGTRGKTGVEYIFGSYAAKIIQSSHLPVLVVQKRHYDSGYKKIVLPIDYSVESKQVVKWAIIFAKKWKSEVFVFGKKYSDEFHAKKTMGNVRMIKKLFEEHSIPFQSAFSDDKKTSFGKQTIQHGIDLKADLIVTTTKLDILIPGFFSGGLFSSSFDEAFIEAASQIPILCINPQDLNVIIGGL